MAKSDFYGKAGQEWLEGLYKFQEHKLIKRVYTWLHKNVRLGEPLWITLNPAFLALLRRNIKTYQPENEDWRWVVGGFTTWNRIQKLFRLVDKDGGQGTRSMKEFQEQDLKLDRVSGTARDVALQMETTIAKVATKHFIRKDLGRQFIRRKLEKNWMFFANETCSEGSKLPGYRGPKSYHINVEL